MDDYVYRLTLDLNCNKNTPIINSAQFDKGRKIHLTVTANGDPFSLSDCSVVMKGVHADKTHLLLDCDVENDGTAIVSTEDTTFSVAGLTVCKLVISNSQKTYSTQKFLVQVESSLDSDITADERYSVLDRLIRQIQLIDEVGGIAVDDEFNETSEHPVQNKVLTRLTEPYNLYDPTKYSGMIGNNANRYYTMQNDGSIKCTTSANDGQVLLAFESVILEPGTYTLSGKMTLHDTIQETQYDRKVLCRIDVLPIEDSSETDSDIKYVILTTERGGSVNVAKNVFEGWFKATFTINARGYLAFEAIPYYSVHSGVLTPCTISDIQIVEGSEIGIYSPNNTIPNDVKARTGVREAKAAIDTIAENINESLLTTRTIQGDYLTLTRKPDYSILKTIINTAKTDLGVVVGGKNLICYPYANTNSTRTHNGITYTVNESDKSITANGTATGDSSFNISQNGLPSCFPKRGNGKYGGYLSGCTGGSAQTFYIAHVSSGHKQYNDPFLLESSVGLATGFQIVIKSGVTVTNKVFRPMFSVAPEVTYDKPATLYRATVESGTEEYTWQNIVFRDGYNTIVPQSGDSLNISVDYYFSAEQNDQEIREVEGEIFNVKTKLSNFAESYNLYNPKAEYTVVDDEDHVTGGYTVSGDDGNIICDIAFDDNHRFLRFSDIVLKAGTYTLSGKMTLNSSVSDNTSIRQVVCQIGTNQDYQVVPLTNRRGGIDSDKIAVTAKVGWFKATFTLEEQEALTFEIVPFSSSYGGSSYPCTISNLQIIQNSEVGTYSGSDEIPVDIRAREEAADGANANDSLMIQNIGNIFKFGIDFDSRTINNVKITRLNDHSIILNGTATSGGYVNLAIGSFDINHPVIYHKIVCSDGGGNNRFYLKPDYFNQNGTVTQNGYVYDTNKWVEKKYNSTASQGRMYLYINSGSSFNNTVLSFYAFPNVYSQPTDEVVAFQNNARHINGNPSSPKPLTLLHFSDIHADQNALNRILTKAEKYEELIDDKICTGDIVANVHTESISWWNKDVMICIGNHDCATYSGGYNWTALDMEGRYNKYIKDFKDNWGIQCEENTSYYYKDYTEQNVRLIVVDCMKYSGGTEDADQTSWLGGLLSSAKTSGLHVLIAAHAPQNNSTARVCSFSRYGQGARGRHNDCCLPETIIEAVDSAIQNGLKFVGYIVGHTHQDNIWVSTGSAYKQLMYCITCASTSEAQWKDSDQYRNNIDGADAFNLVTIDTKNTLIKLVRGGADIDDHMRPRKTICINYLTGDIVSETTESVHNVVDRVNTVEYTTSQVIDIAFDEEIKTFSESAWAGDFDWTDGYYIDTNGNIVEGSNYRYTSMMPVKSGSSIIYDLDNANNMACTICAYDSQEQFIRDKSLYNDSNYSAASIVDFTGTYVIPDGVSFVRICHHTGSHDQSASVPVLYSVIEKHTGDIDALQNELDSLSLVNHWNGKKWVAFGTSITDNWSQYAVITQGDHAGEPTGKYVPYLLEMSELSSTAFVNRGIAGGSINGHILYYIRYYTADEATADLITIEGAVNDFAASVPLGTVGDTVPYTHELLTDGSPDGTFAGACYQAFTTALTNAPNAVVLLLTETTGKNHTGYANYNQLRKNSLGLYQNDYIDMTVKVAKYVGIPVILCGSESMINAQNPQYIADHIHHTYLGGYQYAKVIWENLRHIPLKALTLPQ